MKKIIIASNKYSFCLEGYQKLADKYWGEDQDFTILAFKTPSVKLAENYSLKLLGPGLDDNTSWCDALLPYFKSIHDDFFFLCFEDHFLVSHVNVTLMSEAEKIMTTDKNISKVRLLPEYRGYNTVEREYNNNFNILDSNANPNNISAPGNRCSFASLRPSIWRRSTFMDMLSCRNTHTLPHRVNTPHDFERVNKADTNHSAKKFLIPKGTYPLYPDLDAFRSGAFHALAMSHGPISGWWGPGNDSFTLRDEDQAIFIEARNSHRILTNDNL